VKLLEFILKWTIGSLFRVRAKGFERLDFTRPMILAPNHTSLLDAIFLALYLPKHMTFVVNTEIARRFSFIMKHRPHITIDPLNPYSIRKMVRVIGQNKPLVIFPEGRITTTGGLMKIYSGIGYLALRTGAQVYPIILQGLERSKFSYLGDKNKTKWFPPVQIKIGTPVTLGRNKSRSVRVDKLNAADKLYRIIQNEWLKCRLKEKVNFYNELLEAARINGSKRLIVQELMQSLTYRHLLLVSTLLSLKLRKHLTGQTTAGILLPNSIGHVITLFALFRTAIQPAILNFSQGRKTILECCATAGIQSVVTSKVFVQKANLEELISSLKAASIQVIYLEDVKKEITGRDKLKGILTYKIKVHSTSNEMILFTSGSESKPKGVVLRHENIYANIQQVKCAVDITSKDKIFNALPMFHSFGLTAGTFLPILSGVQTYLYPTPLHYKAIPELCYDTNTTILFGTSTFLAGYARFAHPYDFYSIRYVFAGAEKLKDEVRQLWMDKFGIRIFEGYGATETSPILALNTPLAYKQGTVGKALPGIQTQIEPIAGIERGGRLLVQGPNVMKGYLIYGKGLIPADDWYDTGDVVEQDEQGFLTIQARLRRFAKVGGEMVSLQQIEELAAKCFNHHELAVVSMTDLRKGERIVLYSTQETDHLEMLRTYLSKQGYSPLMCPLRINYLEKIPLLGSGKTDYVALKQLAFEKGGF
jgi:acyl-[acyl-carrier-protein]-phospholipid O-acyltransferase / long-chain-fatty-acid--[acyl-carrier-protein] ligase